MIPIDIKAVIRASNGVEAVKIDDRTYRIEIEDREMVVNADEVLALKELLEMIIKEVEDSAWRNQRRCRR